jgi:hypothetical protein
VEVEGDVLMCPDWIYSALELGRPHRPAPCGRLTARVVKPLGLAATIVKWASSSPLVATAFVQERVA